MQRVQVVLMLTALAVYHAQVSDICMKLQCVVDFGMIHVLSGMHAYCHTAGQVYATPFIVV